MSNLLDYVSNPDVILKTVTKNKNGEDVVKLTTLVSIPIKSGEALASIEINTLKDKGEGDELYNLVVTFFDFKENYLRNLFVKYGAEIKYKKETLSQDNPKLHKWLGTIEESVSKDSIDNPIENVKENVEKNSDRVTIDYSHILEMQKEVGQIRESIKTIESSADFKSQMDKLSEAIDKGDTEKGISEYNQWKEKSGYANLLKKRDSIQLELEKLRKASDEEYVNSAIQKEQEAIAKSGLSEADYFRKQAVKEFGYTPYFYDAGYITPNGKMLNFSGEKGKHFGSRGQDHRAIGIIYENTKRTDALNRFIKDGNIRIMAESPGIDLSTTTEPTKEQYSTIRRFIYEYAKEGFFNVDLTDESGNVIGSLEYENNINPTRIINDIKHYYSTGEIRQQSDVAKFRYSDRDRTTQINQSMTMDEAKQMIQRAFILGDIQDWYDGEYKNGDEWLRAQGADEVAMYIENEYTLQEKYINKIQGIIDDEFYVADVLEAYLNGTLVGKEKPKAKRLDVSINYRTNDERFYSPQRIENVKQLFEIAGQKLTVKNRAEVSSARAKILLFAHNQGASELLGLSQAELNKKLRSWSGYTAGAREASQRINKGVADSNKWTGIENCSWLYKSQVTTEELESLVKSIEGAASDYEKMYIARTMLALDTHIDWSWLSIEFDTKDGVNKKYNGSGRCNGFYRNDARKIVSSHNSPDTIAHEMGHALDYQWGRDLGFSHSALTDTYRNTERITDADTKQFFDNFKIFIDSLTDNGDIRSEYTQDPKEVFARFVARFIQWVDNTGTGHNTYNYEYSAYKDNFTASHYVEFVKLLQEKAMLDAKRMETGEDASTVKYSDRAYMEAVESGDMETAQKMVDEAAKKAGYKIRGHHGTDVRFTIFNREKTKESNDFGQGFYFSSSEWEAQRYQNDDTHGDTYNKIYGVAYDNAVARMESAGEDINDDAIFTPIFNEEFDKELKRRQDEGTVISAYLKMNNPFIVSSSKWITEEEAIEIAKNTMYVDNVPDEIAISDWVHSVKTYAKQHDGKVDTEYFANKMGHATNLTNALLHQGKYDGILDYSIREKFNSLEDYHAIALYPNKIKDSSPVTYDDNGNVIPLSQRFNTDNEDIRYSDRDYRLNNRNILANALESTTTNPTEREWLAKYKANIASLNADQKKLDEINAEIKAISFTKGSDRSKLTALYNNKKTLTARITRADKKLLEIESAKVLKNVLEVEKKRVAEKIKAQAREDMKAQKEISAQTVRTLMDKYTERAKRGKEGRDKTAVKQKIRKTISYLNSILNRGTRERNVKLGLRDTVSKALATAEVLYADEITNADIVRLGVESVTDKEMDYLNKYEDALNRLDELNMRLGKAKTDEEIAELNAEISKASSQVSRYNSLLKDVFVRERARLNRQVVSDTLDSLAKAYKELQNSTDDYIKNNAYVQGMYERITNLSKDLEGVTIKDMSLEQLESVYEIYKMVKHMVTEANNIFRKGRSEDLSTIISNVQAEIDAIVSSAKDMPDAIARVADFLGSFTWNELKPYAAFERLGSKTFEELFWDVIEADNVWARDTEEAANVIEEARKKYGYKKWDTQTTRHFKSANGLDFKLTLGDMMSIYAYSKRPQAQDHMTIGGFTFDTGSTYKEKKKEKGVSVTYRRAKLSETYKVDPKLIGDVIAELEKIEGVKEYVDEVQSYLTKLGEKGNEVSRIMFGIDLFKEKAYFPLQSAKDYRSSIEQTLNATQTMASLKNTGVSKETVPHANNPIVLRSFDDVVLEHINTMAKYHAYVVPIENLSKVFNNVGKDTFNGDYTSTQALISSKFGSSATEYFKQFITDLNGGSFGGGANNPLAKLFGTAKGVSVAANLSVVVQQYFAVVRAMDEINPKYMIPFLNGEASKSDQKQWEELKKYAPVGIIKQIGGFDMGANRSAVDYMGDAETKTDAKKIGKKVKDASMWLAGKMDEIGWSTIWRAVKKEIADTTSFNVGSEEFFQACGERFTEIIVKTQVYDSITSRSGYMRSKHESVKYLTSFMGEPTAIVNMMYLKQLAFVRAIKSKDKKAIKKASQNLARTSAVIILSTVLTSLAKSLPYAMRDDEEEDGALLERWAKHFGEATASDMNPLNMLPVGRDIVSIWEGWDVERPDMTLISDIFTSVRKAIDDDCTTEEAMELAGALANIFGYPLKNVIRDAKGIIRLFGDVTDDVAPMDISGGFTKGFTGESDTDALWNALKNGDTEKLNNLKKEYKTQSEYNSAVRKALKENDPRIEKAAEAKYSGDMDTFKQIVLEIKAEGRFSQDDIVSAVNSMVTSIKKENEEETTEEWYNEEETQEESGSVYKNSDVNDALKRGDMDTAKEIINDIVDAKVKSGKTKAEAQSSIKSSLTSYWKDIYLEASETEKANIRNKLLTYTCPFCS